MTYVKDAPLLAIFGVLFISIFGGWLKRRYNGFDFNQKYGWFFFIFDNYELAGAVLLGVGLILIAIFG